MYNLRLLLTTLIFVFHSCLLISQKGETYSPLRCSGEIPYEFRSLTATKVQKAQAEEKNKKEHTYKEKKRVNEFLLRNNYVIDELLNSGKVLYGDPVTEYINAVAAKLLVNDPELKSKLRFYAVKSNDVNAFATNMGIIFVTVGLIAQIENEAQLAFVLAHEIAHYEKEHSLASVLETAEIINKTQNDHYNGYENRIKLLSSFSQEMEFEADLLGYKRFVASGYDKNAAITMMDVLQFSFTPFLEVPFKPDFLQLDSLVFPDNYVLKDPEPVPLDTDDEDDSKRSHPNIKKRRTRLQAEADLTIESGTLSHIGNAAFESVRKLARNEMIHLDIIGLKYIDALYHAYAMSTLYPNSRYYEESIGKALYGMSKYTNNGDHQHMFYETGEVYTNLEVCNYLLKDLTDEQLNLIAIRYLYYVSDKYESVFMKALRDDLIKDGIVENELRYDSLSAGIQEARTFLLGKKNWKPKDMTDGGKLDQSINAMNSEGVSKYDKLREEKSKSDSLGTNDEEFADSSWVDLFHYMAFSNLNMPTLKTHIDSIFKKNNDDELALNQWNREVYSRKGYYRRRGFGLGLDKVVFVDPFFFKIDEREGVKLVDSEKELLDFSNQIGACSEACGLDSDMLLPKGMQEGDVKRYNDMALMNDWIGEKLTHESHDIAMIPLQTDYTSSIADSYGTDYFCYTGVFTTKMKRRNTLGYLIYGILFYPIIPFVLIRAFIPERNTYFYFLLYNMRTGETKWEMEKNIRRSADNGYVNSLLYDTMYQVKAKK